MSAPPVYTAQPQPYYNPYGQPQVVQGVYPTGSPYPPPPPGMGAHVIYQQPQQVIVVDDCHSHHHHHHRENRDAEDCCLFTKRRFSKAQSKSAEPTPTNGSGARSPSFLSTFRFDESKPWTKALITVARAMDLRNKRVRSAFLHVGLVILCVSYILIGAQIFLLIERPVEQRARTDATRRFGQLKDDLISNISLGIGNFDRLMDAYTKEMLRMFDEEPFALQTFETLDRNGSETEVQWSYAGAVLFTSTTVIPVGYGFIAPSTSFGRAFVIIYGMIGIPLALVTMADAGKFLSKFVLDFFEESLVIPTIMFTSFLVVYPLLGGLLFNLWTGMSALDSIYFSLTSIFTIGFGDIMPDVDVMALVLFNIIGVILVTISVEWVAAEAINNIHYMGRQVGKARLLAEKMMHIAQSLSVNKGIGAGMTQLHALAKFGMFAKFDAHMAAAGAGGAQGPPKIAAFAPELDEDDELVYMDHGVPTDIRASKLQLDLYNL
ncbi:unnamed protein product, partial [Mesorhabditis spiculigera]